MPIERCKICFRELEGSAVCQGNRNTCSEWTDVQAGDQVWTKPFRDDTRHGAHCIYQWRLLCEWVVTSCCDLQWVQDFFWYWLLLITITVVFSAKFYSDLICNSTDFTSVWCSLTPIIKKYTSAPVKEQLFLILYNLQSLQPGVYNGEEKHCSPLF